MDDNDDQEIHEAAHTGDVEKLRSLLDDDPELIDAIGRFERTPLHAAAQYGKVECVRLLLERGAEVNSTRYLMSKTPLFEALGSASFAASNSDALECTRLLLEHGADPNIKDSYRGEFPIFHAHSLDAVLLLQKYGADLDVISNEDQYPFESQALSVSDPALLKFWLERGVEVNHIPGFGNPVFCAVVAKLCWGNQYNEEEPDEKRDEERLAQIGLLFDFGAEPNIGDSLRGESPLHIATEYERMDIARLLLDGGADPNFKNHANETPLHTAVEKKSIELVQLFVERGADVNLKNINKKSAWDLVQDVPELRTILEPHARDIADVPPTPVELVHRLLDLPRFDEEDFQPCPEGGIAQLEEKFDVVLPETYQRFLRLMGAGFGGFLETDHWDAFYPYLLDMGQQEKYAQRCDDLPEKYFVFASRLAGVYLFFIADGTNDDPPVYSFGDGHDDKYRKAYDSFWGFIEEMVIQYEYYSKMG
jgi:ankyrin repeat protein